MKVDIWSDIRCPFCYIGKRKFEAALDKFENKDKVEIEWHSFELDPTMKTEKDANIYDYLSERKAISIEQSKQMHAYVSKTASEVGLQYNFDKTVVASSFDGHRLIQLAKKKGLGDIAEEKLFKAYFTNGVDISDHSSLVEIGVEIGLQRNEVQKMLQSESLTEEVREDESIAETIGVNGVPFFVFDQKYAVSGAQSSATFLEVLEKSWNESIKNDPIEVI